jgi:hypothetical protein
MTLAVSQGTAERSASAQQQHSAGDVAQARELFNQGLALRESGDLGGAIEKLRAAHGLASTPITGVELGRTYLSAGKLVEAREVLLSVGRLPLESRETQRSATARADATQLAEQMRTRIPSLLVKVNGVPLDSVAVTIDGAAVATEALTAPRLVNPGLHEIVATSTSGGNASTKVDVKEGESRSVELRIVFVGVPSAKTPLPADGTPASGAAVMTAIPPDTGAAGQSSSVLPAVIYTGFGLAAAGVVVGSVAGVIATHKASAVKNACDGLVCPRSIDGDLSTGRAMGTVSTIAFVAAGAGAAVGLIALVLRTHHENAGASASWVAPWVGPASAGLSGRFQF